jgi:hypothetical protein
MTRVDPPIATRYFGTMTDESLPITIADAGGGRGSGVLVRVAVLIVWLAACDGSTSGPVDAQVRIDGALIDSKSGPDGAGSNGMGSDSSVQTTWCADLATCCDTLTGVDYQACVDAYDASAGNETACRGYLESIQSNGACT